MVQLFNYSIIQWYNGTILWLIIDNSLEYNKSFITFINLYIVRMFGYTYSIGHYFIF